MTKKHGLKLKKDYLMKVEDERLCSHQFLGVLEGFTAYVFLVGVF
jgi:hypothetical protein